MAWLNFNNFLFQKKKNTEIWRHMVHVLVLGFVGDLCYNVCMAGSLDGVGWTINMPKEETFWYSKKFFGNQTKFWKIHPYQNVTAILKHDFEHCVLKCNMYEMGHHVWICVGWRDSTKKLSKKVLHIWEAIERFYLFGGPLTTSFNLKCTGIFVKYKKKSDKNLLSYHHDHGLFLISAKTAM